jgi:Asp-tRNA(Asn)/Glu-tRNA(Gln) amidotransferase A subunit family amidase
MFLSLSAAAALAVDALLLLVALPLIVVQVLLRTARSSFSAWLHRLSSRALDAGAARRAARDRASDALQHAVPPAHASLASSAGAIAAALRAGEYSSVDCVRAYVNQARRVSARGSPVSLRALRRLPRPPRPPASLAARAPPLAASTATPPPQANGCLNAIRDERFDAALGEAAAADERLRQWRASGRPAAVLPPLLGVPCSIKEVLAHAGLRQTGGTLWHRDRRATADEEASPVLKLRRAGVIVLCCTASPELGMWYETAWATPGGGEARTSNPYAHHYSVGGSSGGEAALVAAAGAPFGVGSDIGGSIRMVCARERRRAAAEAGATRRAARDSPLPACAPPPRVPSQPAAFVGVFGHKPTGGLVSNAGQFPTQDNAMMSTGPLCRYSSDLLPLLTLLRGADARDPSSGEMWLVDVDLPLRARIVESLAAAVHAPLPPLEAAGGGRMPLASPPAADDGAATAAPLASPALLVVDRTASAGSASSASASGASGGSGGSRSAPASPQRLRAAQPPPASPAAAAAASVPWSSGALSSAPLGGLSPGAVAAAFSAAGRAGASPLAAAARSPQSPFSPHSPAALAAAAASAGAAYELPASASAAAEQHLRLRRGSAGGGLPYSPVRAPASPAHAAASAPAARGPGGAPLEGGSTGDAMLALLGAESCEERYHAPAAVASRAAAAAAGGGASAGGGGAGDASLLWPRPPAVTRWHDVTVFVIDDLAGVAPFLSSPVAPSITAAINTAARTLTDVYGARGVARLALPELYHAFDIWSASIAAAGQPSFRSMLADGYGGEGPGGLRIGRELFRWVIGASRSTLPALVLAAIEDVPARLAPARMRRLVQEGAALRARVSATLAAANGVLLCPVHPTTAPLHDMSLLRGPWNIAHTAVWNVCRTPVTVVPMGLDGAGLPVAIQVVGAERFDRLTIAVAQALEAAGVAGWLPPAATSTCPKCRVDSGEAAAAEAAARGGGLG